MRSRMFVTVPVQTYLLPNQTLPRVHAEGGHRWPCLYFVSLHPFSTEADWTQLSPKGHYFCLASRCTMV